VKRLQPSKVNKFWFHRLENKCFIKWEGYLDIWSLFIIITSHIGVDINNNTAIHHNIPSIWKLIDRNYINYFGKSIAAFLPLTLYKDDIYRYKNNPLTDWLANFITLYFYYEWLSRLIFADWHCFCVLFVFDRCLAYCMSTFIIAAQNELPLHSY
jgi:hypothetical protein